jgi:hypothetical protein
MDMSEYNGLTQKIPNKPVSANSKLQKHSEFRIYCAEFMKSINPNWMKEKDSATMIGSESSPEMMSTLWIKFL